MSISSAKAQFEYLSTLDYHNAAVNRIAHIPGVTWVTNKSTYDANHQHFFFLGLVGSGPERLYTLDAVTGNVLSNPLFPSWTYIRSAFQTRGCL